MSLGKAILKATKRTLAVTALVIVVVTAAWFWLSAQLNTLLQERIDESGEYYSQVMAIAASEAMVSGDTVYLQTLTEQLLTEPYINKVIFYSSDGSIILEQQAPPEEAPTINENNEWQKRLSAYLPKYLDPQVDFMPEVIWNNEMVGWAQLTIDRHYLESDIRESSFQVTLVSLFVLGLTIVSTFLFTLIRTLKKNGPYHLSEEGEKQTQAKLSDVTKIIKSKKGITNALHFKKPNLQIARSDSRFAFKLINEPILLTVTVELDIDNESVRKTLERQLHTVKNLIQQLKETAANLMLNTIQSGKQLIFTPSSVTANNEHDDKQNIEQLKNLFLLGWILEKLEENDICGEPIHLSAIIKQPKQIIVSEQEQSEQLFYISSLPSAQSPFGLNDEGIFQYCKKRIDTADAQELDSFSDWLDTAHLHIGEHHYARFIECIQHNDTTKTE